MGRMSASTYTIGRSTGRCAATGRDFAPGERFVAALCERAGEEPLVRVDFALDAWSAGARPAPPLRMLGSWRTSLHHASGPARSGPLLDDEGLLDLLRGMAGDDSAESDPRRAAIRFVLALMLVRRKLLIPEPGGHAAATLCLRVRGTAAEPGGAELIEVTDPGLDESAMTAAIEQIEALAGGPESA